MKTKLEKALKELLQDYYRCKDSGPGSTNEYYWIAQIQKTIKEYKDAEKKARNKSKTEQGIKANKGRRR